MVVANGYLMFTGAPILWTCDAYDLSKSFSFKVRAKGGVYFAISPLPEAWVGDFEKLQAITIASIEGHGLWVREGLYRT